MTLASQIALDVSAVFLDTDDFAQTITHYPEDDRERRESIVAIFDRDDLEGASSGLDGDARRLHNEDASTVRESGVVECSTAVEVTTGREQYNSTFLIGGQIWTAKRVLSIDADMQSVLVIRVASKTTRRTKPNRG